ncbi:hypothetical protein KKJFFJLC_00001 [Vibrio phage vB_VpaS_PGB]|nr:hypothetical protein KKJFFJLC_00001 [Vibrio phage vB_VpaS_PGB]
MYALTSSNNKANPVARAATAATGNANGAAIAAIAVTSDVIAGSATAVIAVPIAMKKPIVKSSFSRIQVTISVIAFKNRVNMGNMAVLIVCHTEFRERFKLS